MPLRRVPGLRDGPRRSKLVSLTPNYSRRVWPDHKEARKVIAEAYRHVDTTKPSADDARRLFGSGHGPE